MARTESALDAGLATGEPLAGTVESPGRGARTRLPWSPALIIATLVVAAICAAPVVLARAGILAGQKATVAQVPGAVDELTWNGAIYLTDHVVVSGRIITADGPASSTPFGQAVWDVVHGPP